jgi:tRNA(Ile)-lysidine synthase
VRNFLRNFITEWRKLDLPFADATFIAAVSGGADSVSLLLALKELRDLKKLDLRFVIAHFNHQLRGDESDKDEEFVRHLTTEYGFELAVGRGNVSHEGNLEQNARNARYEFLTRTAENLHATGVLTAHTMNDQAETFLINLIRGSGIDGLAGMKALRGLKSQATSPRSQGEDQVPLFNEEIPLIRPLLNWAKRADTENFCRELGVEYRYDTMNEDLAFKRVRVRKVLLPMLEDMNPKIVETLAQTAGLLRLETERKETKMEEPVKGTGEIPDGALSLKELKLIETAELYNKLRVWLGERRGNLRRLELKHIESIERLIHSKKSGKTIELPGGDTVVKRRGMIMFVARSGQSV